MAGSAQTQTMTVIMTHAPRLPTVTPVQITVSATIMIVRKARPSIRVIVFVDRMHAMVEGSNHRTPIVSKTLETRKTSGRILKAGLLIVRGKFRGILISI